MNTNPESVAVPTRADSKCAELIACGVDDDDPQQVMHHAENCPAADSPAVAQSALKVRLTRLLAEDDPANYSHDLTNEDVDHIVDLVLGVVESWAERDIEGIEFVAANRIALAARHFCEELQEDGEGVPQLELKELNAALDAWEAYPDARGTFDDTQPILAALTSLVEDQHATDHQRRVAHLALSELRRITAVISATPTVAASEPDSIAPQTCVKCGHSGTAMEDGYCEEFAEPSGRCGCFCVFPARAESEGDGVRREITAANYPNGINLQFCYRCGCPVMCRAVCPECGSRDLSKDIHFTALTTNQGDKEK